MALKRRLAGLVVAVFAVTTAVGCSAKSTTGRAAPATALATPPATAPATPPAVDGASFSHISSALRSDIAARADAMKQGPIGNRGVELASLRLAASGRDLIDAGSLDGALEALQRAVSLYGRNGYAYLYLAYVHHEQGRDERAAEFAAVARRYLPTGKAVEAELDGLTAAIRVGAATAGF